MKNLIKINLSLLIFLFLVSCGQTQKKEAPKLTDENSVLIKHQLGETRVPDNPKRVVVLEYGSLDTMKELGLEEEIVGIPKKNLPAYLGDYEKDESIKNTGSLVELNFQTINELQPDLIIIGNRQIDDYQELSEIAPTIFTKVDYNDYTASFRSNAQDIGRVFGKEKQVKEELAELDKEVQEIKKYTDNDAKKALVVMYNERKVSAYGEGSRFGIIHDVFGINPVKKNMEVAVHGKSISNEYIYEKNPDYLFIIDRGAAINTNKANKNEIENELIRKTAAYKNDDIVYLSPDVWYLSGGGLISFKRMISEVKNAIY